MTWRQWHLCPTVSTEAEGREIQGSDDCAKIDGAACALVDWKLHYCCY